MGERFEPEGLWSFEALKNWEKEAFQFFRSWGPLVFITGVTGGTGAVIFRYLLNYNQDFFFRVLGINHIPILFLPVLGALIVGPIINKYASEAWGAGIPQVMESLMSQGGKIRSRVALVKIIVSSITIGSGGSAGREGPIAQIGASLASIVGQLFHSDERTLKLLVMAGASAGISGTFKAPIGGAFFGLEVLNREIRTTDMIVIGLSSIIGYSVSVAILGSTAIFNALPFTPKDIKSSDMILYLILGLIGGLASYLWTRSLYGVEYLFERLGIQRKWFSPFVGAWVVGVVGLFFPEALGLGYDQINQFFNGTLPIHYDTSLALFFLMLLLAKVATSAFTIGSGGSGGMFSPSLFMGTMIGTIFGQIVDGLLPSISPGYYSFALVGMGMIFAGSAKAPFMSTIILAEMTHSFYLLPAFFLANITSYLLSGPGSIYFINVEKTLGKNIPDKYFSTPKMPKLDILFNKPFKARKLNPNTEPSEQE